MPQAQSTATKYGYNTAGRTLKCDSAEPQPDMPEWLTGEAQVYWESHASRLWEPGYLTVADVGLKLRRAQLEKTLKTARSHRLKTDLLAASLLARVDVERDIRLALSRVVARLSSLGLECANVAPGEIQDVVKTVVEERVRIALKELSDGGLV